MADARHLVTRFLGSLSPAPPAADDERWACAHLLPGERQLWDRLSNPDRRHAIAVARRVVARLGSQASRPVIAAALLHDVGKLDSGLGTFGRVGAIVVAAVAGRRRVGAWSAHAGWRGRLGRYVRHDELGAALLASAGSDPLTVAWAGEHHAPPHAWTVPGSQAAALKAADDD